MNEPFQELANLDRLIHEGSRLAIMTALAACESADFLYLSKLTGLTAGNLSSHLTRLEEVGLVTIHKQFVGKKPHTHVQITPQGTKAIEEHWRSLDMLRQQAQQWRPNAK